MNNELRELNPVEMVAVAGGMGLGRPGSPAEPDQPIFGDGNPFHPISGGTSLVPIVQGGTPINPPAPGKP